jgi:hypothetical protein
MQENATQKDTRGLITCGLLVLCCFLLTAILLTLHKNSQNGRYAWHCDNMTFCILDTKTSHVWYREPHPQSSAMRCYDFGTIDKPALVEVIYNFGDEVIQTGRTKNPLIILPDKH